MSLYENSKFSACFLEKTRLPDGEGGFITEWREGAKFMAAFDYSTSVEARIAEHQGVTNLYSIKTEKSVDLMRNDVIKRLFDGKIFRVTSDGTDKKTPEIATIDMRVVTAEEWSLPT